MNHLSVVCNEPEGPIERHVTPIIFTEDNVKKFYEKASKFPVLFGKPLNSLEDFLPRFFTYDSQGIPHLKGPIWQVDDFVGVFYLTDLYVHEATAHFVFFDGRFKGRHQLVKQMIKEVMKESSFVRLNVEIPLYAGKAVFKFVSDIGFTLEGRKRANAFYKGKWFGSNLYGLLRSEVLKDGS